MQSRSLFFPKAARRPRPRRRAVVPAAKEETAEKTESAAQEAERENAQTSAETKAPREGKAHKEEKTKAEQMSVLSDKKMLGGTLLK